MKPFALTILKRSTMWLHNHRLLPAGAVTWIFRRFWISHL